MDIRDTVGKGLPTTNWSYVFKVTSHRVYGRSTGIIVPKEMRATGDPTFLSFDTRRMHVAQTFNEA